MASTSSRSPISGYGERSGGDGPAAAGLSAGGQDPSPLGSMNSSFLKALGEKRTTRDGNTPKRRGPKPDSKPALTRRQELNRQAQRTHRERKELYIKALEDEVLRLKEVYSNICREKETLAEENKQLKAMITQNGLSLGPEDAMSNPSNAISSSGSVSGSYAPASSNTSAFSPPATSASHQQQMHSLSPRGHGQQQQQQGQIFQTSSTQPGAGLTQPGALGQSKVDYDQAGIDFVLTYDNPLTAYPSPPPAERP